ncbi:response regulator [Aurantimonas sp. HBX-1]|uniref:response regulator n=1 Tax=Aurantimonas sp. HBX-1 TaxID=2906072 RepID=UPI001F2C05A8|nr:response regulator transcription factor [Aurantimonas sp. HBX-1]UIJ72069.1 response regulator transcription factor [Aurantimonas sp. HBX-1]
MKQPTILVVDDEPAIHRFLKPSLTAEGYLVIQAMNGTTALALAASERPDAIVLDLGLPDIDGKRVIERLRRTSDVPIVVLSARDREAEKVQALDLGADDYVEKPFGIGELMARLRAALRHRQPAAPGLLKSGDLSLDLEARIVRNGAHTVKLTRREFDLLAILLRHAGRVVTHKHLLHEVWGKANEADTQYLRVYIGHLRQKLEDDPAAPTRILTEAGVGYRLV